MMFKFQCDVTVFSLNMACFDMYKLKVDVRRNYYTVKPLCVGRNLWSYIHVHAHMFNCWVWVLIIELMLTNYNPHTSPYHSVVCVSTHTHIHNIFLIRKFAVLNVERNDEFSPLKNAPGAPRDCPETCRDSLMALHYRHIIAAGGVVDSENGTTTSSRYWSMVYVYS